MRSTAWDNIDERCDISVHLRGMVGNDNDINHGDKKQSIIGMEDALVVLEVAEGAARVPWEGGILIQR